MCRNGKWVTKTSLGQQKSESSRIHDARHDIYSSLVHNLNSHIPLDFHIGERNLKLIFASAKMHIKRKGKFNKT